MLSRQPIVTSRQKSTSKSIGHLLRPFRVLQHIVMPGVSPAARWHGRPSKNSCPWSTRSQLLRSMPWRPQSLKAQHDEHPRTAARLPAQRQARFVASLRLRLRGASSLQGCCGAVLYQLSLQVAASRPGDPDCHQLQESSVLTNGLSNAGSKREGEPEEAAPKKRRKRKPRLPKNFDPANPGPPPDPERWLAKWQRSDYKKKKDRNARPRKVRQAHAISMRARVRVPAWVQGWVHVFYGCCRRLVGQYDTST